MPATILDSAVFRDVFTTEAMRTVFSDENRVQKYLDFEAALARLEEIVRTLEKGEAPLDRSIELYQEGDRLKRIDNQQGMPANAFHGVLEDHRGRIWAGAPRLYAIINGKAKPETAASDGNGSW